MESGFYCVTRIIIILSRTLSFALSRSSLSSPLWPSHSHALLFPLYLALSFCFFFLIFRSLTPSLSLALFLSRLLIVSLYLSRSFSYFAFSLFRSLDFFPSFPCQFYRAQILLTCLSHGRTQSEYCLNNICSRG